MPTTRKSISPSSISAGADVLTLQSFEIDEHWHWIEPLLKRVENHDWKLSHVKADLKSAKAQLWALVNNCHAPQAIVVTRVENFHDIRWGLVWIAAGKGIEHVPMMLEHIEPWFKEMGCSHCEVSGRKGWEK